MAFTDRSDLYGALDEEGINFVVRHVMQQRPSLFNYATQDVADNPEFWCERIRYTQDVVNRANPIFTVEDPMPILGTDGRWGLDFCIQLLDAEVDLAPGNAFQLPPELAPLPDQRFALHVKACAGLGCPDDEILDRLERVTIHDRLRADPSLRAPAAQTRTRETYYSGQLLTAADFRDEQRYSVDRQPNVDRPPRKDEQPKPPARPLPHRGVQCFCLEVYVVGHFDTQGALGATWLRPRLDGLEIVDIKPDGLEAALECYLTVVLRLGILPKLMTLIGKSILDLLAELPGITITAPVGGAIPFNPAIEDDQLKVFVGVSP